MYLGQCIFLQYSKIYLHLLCTEYLQGCTKNGKGYRIKE